MSTSVVDIGGVKLTSASIFNRDCSFAISHLQRYMPADEVIRNFPVFVGEWEDGTVVPFITGRTHEVDTTGVEGECDTAVVVTDMTECEMVAPDQEELSFKTNNLKWKSLVNKFCRTRNISPAQLGVILNPNGTIDMGNPYAANFARFALAALAEVMAETLARATLKGDNANLNEFDGLYTQYASGWLDDDADCPSYMNTEQTVNWGLLTGAYAAPDPAVAASPNATTLEGMTVTLWGDSYPVPAGLNLAQFLEYWIEVIQNQWTANIGGVTQWEMHAPRGLGKNFASTAACVQPCNFNDPSFYDPDLRERYARFRNTRVVSLYPTMETFPILESNWMPANTLRFIPREIGGRPTYALFLRDIDRVLAEVTGYMPTYGNRMGGMNLNEPLLPQINTWLQNNFEAVTLHWDITKVNNKCIVASMDMEAGVLATARHLVLKITNVAGESFFKAVPSIVEVDGVALS